MELKVAPAETCTIRLPIPGRWGEPGNVCGRPLSHPCGYCREYDRHKADWAELFANQPRVAVEGDI